MDKLKQWVALTVLLVLAVAAGGWFLLITPKRGEAADLTSQAATQEAANQDVATQLNVLKAQSKELPKKKAELADFATKIPDIQATPALIRLLVGAADAAGVDLNTITPSTPAASTDATATGPAGTLLDASVDLKVYGSYAELQQFMANVETLPRVLRTTSLTLVLGSNTADAGKQSATAGVDGSSLSGTVSVHSYIATAAGAVAAAPAAAAPATAAATSSPATPTPSASASSEK